MLWSGAVVGVVCLVAAVASATSLFFYYRLAVFEGQRLAVGNVLVRQEAASPSSFSWPQDLPELSRAVEQRLLAEDVTMILPLFSRYVVASAADHHILAGLPRLAVQPTIAGRLRGEGWQVHRLGWFVVAERSALPHQSSYYWQRAAQAGASLLTSMFKHPQTTHPLMLLEIEVGAWPFIDQPYSALAYREQDGIRVYVQQNTNPDQAFVKGRTGSTEPSDNLEIIAPGRLLILAPESMKSRWDEQLLARFHFLNTKPLFTKVLSSQSLIGIAGQEDHLAIGVRQGTSEFTSQVREWISEELSYQYTEKRAFLLPDGTLGYEYVSTATQPTFRPSQSNPACTVTDASIELWLCSDGTQTVFATDANLGEKLLASLAAADSWRVSMPEQYLPQFPLAGISHIMAQGDARQATILFRYNN